MFNSRFSILLNLALALCLAVHGMTSDEAIAQSFTFRDLFGWRRPTRPLGTRGTCILTPGVGKSVLWNTRPLFMWQGKLKRVSVRESFGVAQSANRATQQILWTKAVNPSDRAIAYGAELSLQAGKQYEWAANELGAETNWLQFEIMPMKQQAQIRSDLQALEQRWNDAEKLALQKASYFADRGFWSDALQTLYEIQNPSPPLIEQRQAYLKEICSQRSAQ